jgi:hypothetical protein
MTLVPFDAELNRFLLKISNPKAESYKVTWGAESKTFTAADFKNGINLAAEFHNNPLVAPFQAIQSAVTAKQAFETKQIKTLVHGDAGKADMEGTFERTEEERAKLMEKLKETIRPAEHSIGIEPAS